MDKKKSLYWIGNWFYRRLATIGGILLLLFLFFFSWFIALFVGVFLVIFKFRHKIWGVFSWAYGGFRWGIRDLRYSRKRRKLKEQDNIYGEY